MNCELTPTYMLNVYKNQPSRQTGSRKVTGPKTLPTIWGTYMKLVTKYMISAINSWWEKCDENYLGMDGRTNRGKTVNPLRWSGGIISSIFTQGRLSSLVNLWTMYLCIKPFFHSYKQEHTQKTNTFTQ